MNLHQRGLSLTVDEGAPGRLCFWQAFMVCSTHQSAARVAVIGGTPGDTTLGQKYVRARGFLSVGLSVAKNPIEQNHLQYFNRSELERRLCAIISCLENDPPQYCLLFCNSLSLAVDMNWVAARVEASGTRFISPLSVYGEVIDRYSRPFVIAANARTLAAIEEYMLSRKPQISPAGYHALDITTDTEEMQGDVVSSLKFLSVIRELAACRASDCLMIACTHLSDAQRDYAGWGIPLVDVGASMIEQLDRQVR